MNPNPTHLQRFMVAKDYKGMITSAPKKFNIDTQNGHIKKEIHFPRPIILGPSMLVFRGVYIKCLKWNLLLFQVAGLKPSIWHLRHSQAVFFITKNQKREGFEGTTFCYKSPFISKHILYIYI